MRNKLTASLRRDDLAYHSVGDQGSVAYTVAVVEDETCFTPDVVHLVESYEEEGPLTQCLIENYDYAPDGCSWTWVPLMHGAIQQERWLPIPWFDGYEAADTGFVRSRISSGIHAGRRRTQPKVLQPSPKGCGYNTVTLYKNGKAYTRRVNRLVLSTFVGPCPAGHEAAHENGRHGDDRLSNLSWKTHQENIDDKRRHGTNASGERSGSRKHPHRRPRGERHGCVKLSDDQVRDIHASRDCARVLAARFGVGKSTIVRIKNQRRQLTDGSILPAVSTRLSSAKLTPDEARQIRAHRGFLSPLHMASVFGISRRQAYAIMIGTAWRGLVYEAPVREVSNA